MLPDLKVYKTIIESGRTCGRDLYANTNSNLNNMKTGLEIHRSC